MSLLLFLLASCAPERDCRPVLWWVGEASRVSVVGDWNGWNPDADPMEPYEGAWRLQVDLPAGDYRYLVEVDGERHEDPFQPLLSWDPWTQEETSLLRVADCGEPALEVTSATATASGDLSVDAVFQRAAGGERLAGAEATFLDGTALEVEVHPPTGEIHAEASGLAPGKHTVVLTARDGDGALASVHLPLWVEETPFAWEDALLYQVVVDRFAADTGELPPIDAGALGHRQGGSWAGLTQVIQSGYMDALGVNGIWISPVYENPQGTWAGTDGHVYEAYHGYWPVSDTSVEPALGTEQDLVDLVEAAHARGIRVLLDVVPNHTHLQHPWYQEHAASWYHRSPDCVCGNYDCPWASDIETCWFTDYLPDLALENPETLAAVMASTVDWARRFDVDGFRVDAVPMMPRAAVRDLVWRLGDLEQGGTRFYTLGETYTGTDYGAIRVNLGPFGLDGQFEFPLLWALRDYATGQEGDAAALEAVVAASEAQWEGSGSVMSPFLGNHDTTRFISEANGDDTTRPWDAPPPSPTDPQAYARLVLAHAITLALPGAPVLYYGDEVGLAGASDPDSRRTMRFTLTDEERWTLDRVRRLGQARRSSEALRRGTRTVLQAEGPVYAFLRDAGDGALALLVANASGEEAVVSLTLPQGIGLEAGTAFGEVVEDGDPVVLTAGAPFSLTLPPWSARLFLPVDQAPRQVPSPP